MTGVHALPASSRTLSLLVLTMTSSVGASFLGRARQTTRSKVAPSWTDQQNVSSLIDWDLTGCGDGMKTKEGEIPPGFDRCTQHLPEGVNVSMIAPLSGCRLKTSSSDWNPTTDMHLIHIPRTMGTSMELCVQLAPPQLNLSGWDASAWQIKGKWTKLINGGMIARMLNKSVIVSYKDGKKSPDRGTLTDVRMDGISPMISLAQSPGGPIKLINRNQVHFIGPDRTPEQSDSSRPGWADRMVLNRTCFAQHMPPDFLAGLHVDDNNFSDPHTTAKTSFCAVRHPFDRLVSQFQFAEKYNYKVFRGGNKTEFDCSVPEMNEYLQQRLEEVLYGDLARDDCHFVPQSLFVYGYNHETGRADKRKQFCKNVLKYETGATSFNNLMHSVGYGLELSTARNNHQRNDNEACRKLSRAELSPEVRRLAEIIYKEDFEFFDYDPHAKSPK